VLPSVQRFEAPFGYRHLWAVHARGFWIHVVRHAGMGHDEDLVPALGFGRPTGARTVVGLDLEGRTSMRSAHGSRELPAGTAVVLPGRGAYRSRVEPSDRESFSMMLEFASAAPTPAVATFAARERAVAIASELCLAIDAAADDAQARPRLNAAVQDLFEFFRAEGFPLPDVDPRSIPPPPPTLHRFGRAVDLALSQTGARPMLVDVERAGAATARTFQRTMPALCEAWGHKEESFRSHARRILLGRACSLMTTRDATTESVARLLGFSTPQAFCRAMARYGLPSPGAVPERFRSLA
jgi:hypothetical protein